MNSKKGIKEIRDICSLDHSGYKFFSDYEHCKPL